MPPEPEAGAAAVGAGGGGGTPGAPCGEKPAAPGAGMLRSVKGEFQS